MIKFVYNTEENSTSDNEEISSHIEVSVADQAENVDTIFRAFIQFMLACSFAQSSIERVLKENADYLDEGCTVSDLAYN